MTETRAARVEQNTRQKAEPSTLYQIYRCINNIRDIVISQPKTLSTMEKSSTSPAASNAIRGAEQSGNIAKQWFARNGVKG